MNLIYPTSSRNAHRLDWTVLTWVSIQLCMGLPW